MNGLFLLGVFILVGLAASVIIRANNELERLDDIG